MAASSVAVTRIHTPGDRFEVHAVFTPSTSYPAGGEPFTPSQFGLTTIEWVVAAAASADGTRLVTWDKTNNKLRIYTAIGTEAANASDQSTKTVPLVVYGT